MKRRAKYLAPQFELPGTCTFNLASEPGADPERLAREQAEADARRRHAEQFTRNNQILLLAP